MRDSKSDYFKFYLLLMIIYIGLAVFAYVKIINLSIFDEKIVTYYAIAKSAIIAIGALYGSGLIACKSEKMTFPAIITILSIFYIIVGSFLGTSSLVTKATLVIQSLMTFFGSLGIISMFRTDSKISFFLSRALCVIDILVHVFYVLIELGASVEFLTKNLTLVYIVLGFFCVGILLLPGISEVFVGGHNRPKNDYQQDDYLDKIKDKSVPPATSNVFNSTPNANTQSTQPKSVIEPAPVMPVQAMSNSALSTPTQNTNTTMNTIDTTTIREVDEEPPKW